MNNKENITAVTKAEDIVAQYKKLLQNTLSEISQDLEWDSPNITFYGETNAGKSTIIETLRLFCRADSDKPGETIGDGQADYTREAKRYACEYENVSFNLIDVPGIEGNEAIVIDEIQHAVNRAHIVFYVTSKSTPPQGGDEGRPGTLEKIKKQLQPQAQVWAIFNKLIATPRDVCNLIEHGDLLAKSDEKSSLTKGENSLDAKMQKALGNHYKGSIYLSALIGFCALADNLPPDSQFLPKKKKFLEKIDRQKLLDFSGVEYLASLLKNITPSQEEILQSNLKKLRDPALEVAKQLAKEGEEKFTKPSKKFGKQVKKFTAELGNIADDSSRAIRRLTDEITDKSIQAIRTEMLRAIDKGLDGDAEIKKRIETEVNKEIRQLNENGNRKVKKAYDNAYKSCTEAGAIFGKELQDAGAFESHAFSVAMHHAAEVNTKSGINWGQAIWSLSGLFAGPPGWVTTAFGLLSSFWNWLDPDYSKKEQKRSVFENLEKMKPKLRENVCKMLEDSDNNLRNNIIDFSKPYLSMEHDFLNAVKEIENTVDEFRRIAEDDRKLRRYANTGAHATKTPR